MFEQFGKLLHERGEPHIDNLVSCLGKRPIETRARRLNLAIDLAQLCHIAVRLPANFFFCVSKRVPQPVAINSAWTTVRDTMPLNSLLNCLSPIPYR